MTDANPLVDDTNRRIVQMLANGHRHREIADELHIARATVSRRVVKLGARVGAKTSAHLVALALRQHWIK